MAHAGARPDRPTPRVSTAPGPAVDGRALVTVLAVVAAVLVGASVAFAGLADAVPGDSIGARLVNALHRFTFTDREGNLWSWFSVLSLALLAVVFAGHAFVQRRTGGHPLPYAALGLVALYLSLDEDVSLHEKLAALVPEHRSTFQWLVYGLPVALVAGLVVLWIARGIDRSLRRRLIVAGVVYLLGAAVTESIEAVVVLAQPSRTEALASFWYALSAGVEEGLEVAGVLLAVRAALLALQVRIAPAEEIPDASAPAATPDVSPGPGAPTR